MTEPTAMEKATRIVAQWQPAGLTSTKIGSGEKTTATVVSSPSLVMCQDVAAALEAHAAAAVRKERERIATKMESGAKHADDLPSLTLMSWAASIRKGATP